MVNLARTPGPGLGENQRPRPLSARTKQRRQAYSPLFPPPPNLPAQLSARLPSPPAPRRASQLAAAVAATVRRVAWPPRARSLPCSLARARAVPSARHASQPETVLPRGCPAQRWGLRTTLARLSCWLVAARRSRAAPAARREGSGKLLATPSPGTRAPAAASRQPAAASAS